MVDIGIPKLIDVDKVENAILKALETVYVAELTRRTPKKTGFTAGQWSAKALGGFIFLITNPKGSIIQFLDQGTSAHTIYPKNKKMLKFRIPKAPTLRTPAEQKAFRKHGAIFFYRAGKIPVLGFTREGSRYYVFAKKVNHPGFAGRFFIEGILQDESLFNKFKQQIIKFL